MNPASEARFHGPPCHRCAELRGDRSKLAERCAELQRENARLRSALGNIIQYASIVSFDPSKDAKLAEPQ